MPFDPILGVGRSPQVTADVIVNSYSIFVQNISSASKIINFDSYGIGISENNLTYSIDDDVGDDVSSGIFGLAPSVPGTPFVSWVYDLGKTVYLSKVSINFKLIRAISYNVTVEISTSNDNISYKTYSTTKTTTTTDVRQDFEVAYIKARFIKVKFSISASSGADVVLTFCKFKAFLDNIQY